MILPEQNDAQKIPPPAPTAVFFTMRLLLITVQLEMSVRIPPATTSEWLEMMTFLSMYPEWEQ
jgi:hypothetical protein